MEEFFQEVINMKSTKQNPGPFKSSKDFHKLAKVLLAEVDAANVESYGSWPFLQHSLLPMMESFVSLIYFLNLMFNMLTAI